jgi:hypothetical protein
MKVIGVQHTMRWKHPIMLIFYRDILTKHQINTLGLERQKTVMKLVVREMLDSAL